MEDSEQWLRDIISGLPSSPMARALQDNIDEAASGIMGAIRDTYIRWSADLDDSRIKLIHRLEEDELDEAEKQDIQLQIQKIDAAVARVSGELLKMNIIEG